MQKEFSGLGNEFRYNEYFDINNSLNRYSNKGVKRNRTALESIPQQIGLPKTGVPQIGMEQSWERKVKVLRTEEATSTFVHFVLSPIKKETSEIPQEPYTLKEDFSNDLEKGNSAEILALALRLRTMSLSHNTSICQEADTQKWLNAAASLLIKRIPLEAFEEQEKDSLKYMLPLVSQLNVDHISGDFIELLPLCTSLKECKIRLKAEESDLLNDILKNCPDQLESFHLSLLTDEEIVVLNLSDLKSSSSIQELIIEIDHEDEKIHNCYISKFTPPKHLKTLKLDSVIIQDFNLFLSLRHADELETLSFSRCQMQGLGGQIVSFVEEYGHQKKLILADCSGITVDHYWALKTLTEEYSSQVEIQTPENLKLLLPNYTSFRDVVNLGTNPSTTTCTAESLEAHIPRLGEILRMSSGFHDQFTCHKAKSSLIYMRYSDMLPYDYNCLNDELGFMINMSSIKGLDLRRRFAGQGPKINTIGDTWSATHKLNISLIVMTTPLIEGGREKCVKYWPDAPLKSSVYRDQKGDKFEVTFIAEESNPLFTKRLFSVKDLKTGTEKNVVQLHIFKWADNQTLSEKEFHAFINEIKLLESGLPGSSFYHCSAGVGRTGVTLLSLLVDQAIEQHVEQFRHTDGDPQSLHFDYQKALFAMRQQRRGMIQTPEQFEMVLRFFGERVRSL